MFNNLINSDFKKLFEDAIDTVISSQGLGTHCELEHDSSGNELCTNCTYDPINKRSSNVYNGTGPASFLKEAFVQFVLVKV